MIHTGELVLTPYGRGLVTGIRVVGGREFIEVALDEVATTVTVGAEYVTRTRTTPARVASKALATV